MNKKFMVVALMAALSTVGYAVTADDVNNRVDVLQEQQKEIDRIQDSHISNVSQRLEGLKNDVLGMDTALKQENIAQDGRLDNIEGTLTQKVDKEEQKEIDRIQDSHISNVSQRLEGLKNDVLGMDTALKQENIAQDGRLDNIESTLTQKVDKAEQAEIDASQQSEIAGLAGQIGNLGNTIIQNKEDQAAIDKSQNETIDGLNQQIGDLANNKADKSEVEDLKTQVGRNEDAIQGNTQQIEDLHKQDANLQEQISNNADAIQGNTQQIVDLNNSKLDKEQYENDKLAQEKRDEEQDGKIDNVSNRLESFKDQVNKDNAAQNDIIANNTQDIDDLKENKVDKNTYEEDKKAQADKDAAQDAEIAKGDRIDKVQNQQIGALQSQNVTQDKNIQANKDAIAQNKNDIAANKAEQDKVNAAQKENNEQQQTAINQNKNDIADLRNDYTQVNGRLSGLEKKVDNLDNKMNKGLSLMAAMNAVDFQSVQAGEMAIGAGVGHYGNAQSVALGVAYSPVEDLTVNAKYSVTAGDADSFALGAGATYKFKVGR